MRTLFSNAINERRTVRVYYDPGWRTVEPHALGYSKEGHLLLRAFQTEGASDSGEHINWKLFRLDRMREADTGNDNFNDPRPGYKRGDSAMKGGIIAQL